MGNELGTLRWKNGVGAGGAHGTVGDDGNRREELFPTSACVRKSTGAQVAPNKRIEGANAFAHEAGIHQDESQEHC